MGSLAQSSTRQSTVFTGRGSLLDRYFYLAMSLLMAAIVVWGFSQTVGPRLLHPAVPRPMILWFHAAVFSGWIAFFIFQSALVRTRNVKLHRFFGWFGAALAAVIVPLGIATAIIMTRFDIGFHLLPDAVAFLIVPLHSMAVFALLVALAILWRKKPELHRRLLFIATCTILGAAFARIPHIRVISLGHPGAFFVATDLLICLGVMRDLLVNRRVHNVYLTVLPVLMASQIFVVYTWVSASPWWLGIAHIMLG